VTSAVLSPAWFSNRDACNRGSMGGGGGGGGGGEGGGVDEWVSQDFH